jgi:hypothetical protein
MSDDDQAFQEAVDWSPGLARRATFLGWSLFTLALFVFGGMFVAAAVYLAVD